MSTPNQPKKAIDELKTLLKLRSQNDFELHVEEVRKKDVVSLNDYTLSNLDTFKLEILEEFKNAKHIDL